MRKYLYLIILFSCLHIAARGQTIASLDDIDLSGLPQPTTAKALRYWFDDGGGSVRTVSQLSGPQELDVSPLRDGLHTLHYQVVDENDKVADVCSKLFMKVNGQAIDVTAKQLRYWFDDDVSTLNVISATSGTQMIDASMLIEGLHTIHYQVEDVRGDASYVASGIFMKTGSSNDASVTAKKLIYWFDDETTINTIDVSDGIQILDAADLQEGLHTIHYQVLCSNGILTPAQSSMFMRLIIDTEGAVAKSLRYWFDDGQIVITTDITTGSTMLDASVLVEGLHTVHYQVVDSKGSLGAPVSSVFMKMGSTVGTIANKMRYWFDDDASSVHEANVNQGIQMLDVSGLLTGLHTVCYQLIDNNGEVGTPYTGIFMKIFDKAIATGENRITQYQYWLNNNSINKQTVTLDGATNPYPLIGLLPVQKEPIHSQLFQFEIANGEPTVYAKNEFHIRFHDAAGYFVDEYKTFVDYSVKQTVTDIELLESGIPSTTTKTEENSIKWFKVTAQKGDSLAFRTHQACTLQLFSPSGKELYSASSPEVLNFDGSYAPEDGTYYIAVHDTKSQYDNNLTVEYQHIDKYAVLSYTPNVFGVLPCGQVVSISGNGFDKLKSVALRNGDDIVVADNYYGGRTEADLLFVLQGNEQKKVYDLVLTFEEDGIEEELVVPKAITLTIPDFSDFKIEITDPRSVANPYPVSVSITNMGNLTYSDIPFFMAYDNVDHITKMNFLNFEVEADVALVNNSLSFIYDIVNFKNKGIRARMIPTFIPVLKPGETVTLKLGFQASDQNEYNVYAWAGMPWSLYANETMAAIQALANSGTGFTNGNSGSGSGSGSSDGSSPDSGFVINLPGSGSGSSGSGNVATSCMPDPCNLAKIMGGLHECLCGEVMGLGKTIGGIQLALQNRHNAALRAQLAESGLYDNPYDFFPSYRLPHPGEIMWNWASHCLPGKVGEAANIINTGINLLGGDPCPDPLGHSANPWYPGDPNDILGYTSESGSKYVREGITDVYYTIEFENDPKIANAAAHTIVVRDTLDTNCFDLSTFAAKSIKLGNKVMELDGEKNFSKRTMDLRPAINVIAQVSLSLDESKGIAKWTIESLDPMSMDPTDDAMQGILPVNINGNGQGEVYFEIKLKPNLPHGKDIKNRAGIIFDQEGVIMTPTWTNTIDLVKPESHVKDVVLADDGMATVTVEATDEKSGPWRYDVYVQYGQGSAWFKAAENVDIDKVAKVQVYPGIDHGFCTIAKDAAGNVEQKTMVREFSLGVPYIPGDVNGDSKVTVTDVLMIMDKAQGNPLEHFIEEAADLNHDGAVTLADAIMALAMILDSME